jgi:ABC-type transport system involved in multi-copper enzyme maturation permease subunit
MTAGTVRAPRAAAPAGRGGFLAVVRAEWTKFRTVRGWVVGMVVAGLLVVGVGLLGHSECGGQAGPNAPVVTGGPSCTSPLGPGGEAVTDDYYLVHQPLGTDGSITVRVTSMTGSRLQPWSKAGIIVTASTAPGSAYAAMMVTAGHGVRMQWDYTQDTPGLAGAVGPASPRWLRLIRAGDTITGYDSADGTRWDRVGSATLAGLPSVAQAGLFAASPDYSNVTSQSIGGGSGSGGSTQATAAFDHVMAEGGPAGGRWAGTAVGGTGGTGGTGGGGPGAPSPDGYRRSGGGYSVTGSGDIAPVTPQGAGSVAQPVIGTFAGLIAVIVVAAMFITAEYRRGLIRVTLAASPRRGRVLAAKALVLGTITFVVGLPAAWAAQLIGEPMERSRGIFIDPVSAPTELRILAGTAALLAVAAVLAVAVGALLRRGAAAVTAVIVVIVLPYFFAGPLAVLPPGAADWLLRVTPAAAFAIQQPYPAYPQVTSQYTPENGYYPLAPWAGLAVLCGWTALVLGLAAYRLRRRDA